MKYNWNFFSIFDGFLLYFWFIFKGMKDLDSVMKVLGKWRHTWRASSRRHQGRKPIYEVNHPESESEWMELWQWSYWSNILAESFWKWNEAMTLIQYLK